jgi:hypothetical protein
VITTLKIPPSKAWRRLHRANATSPRAAHCIATSSQRIDPRSIGLRIPCIEGCGFSSLMKQNKKAKNYAVFCFAGKRKLLFYILRCDCEAKFL